MGALLHNAMSQLEAAHSPLAHYAEMAAEAELLAKRPANHHHIKHWLKTLPPLMLLKAAQELADDLAAMKGQTQQPQSGCIHSEAFIGDADVLVEFEIDGPSGDGWNEPRYEEVVIPIQALINGVWVDCDLFSQEVQDRWQQACEEHITNLRERDEADRAEAMHADRQLERF